MFWSVLVSLALSLPPTAIATQVNVGLLGGESPPSDSSSESETGREASQEQTVRFPGGRSDPADLPPISTAAVPIEDANFSGSSTGTILHADTLQNATTRVVDAEVAFSAASLNSAGLANRVLNEMQREIQPLQVAKNAYARGSGLEIGLAIPPSGENQIIHAGKAEATAAPITDLVTRELSLNKIDPIYYATLLRGQARARFDEDACVLGADAARGLGFATDVQLLDLGGNNNPDTLDGPAVATDILFGQPRSVSQTISRTRLVRQVLANGDVQGPDFGILSEVRETIAPITLLRGNTNQITIEILGEWVLRVVATGLANGAYLHYGPAAVSPQTPVVRILDRNGNPTTVVTFQQFFGNPGQVVTVPGVAEIAIGEDPRAINGNATSTPELAANGTSAAAAVDVVRVKLLEQRDAQNNVTLRAADLRLGHMEARANVPAGGIACALPVAKSANPTAVRVGNTFTTTITVSNPFDCELRSVRLADAITTEQQARFTVVGATPSVSSAPAGTGLSNGDVVWNDIGPIPAKGSRQVTLTLRAQGAAGRIVDVATATGTLGGCTGEDAETVGVAGASVFGVSPIVRVAVRDLPVITVLKSASPAVVTVGNTFVVTITVSNPLDCPLTNVQVTDALTTEALARFKVEGTSPLADQVPAGSDLASGSVVWNDIGPIPARSARAITMTLRGQGGTGIIRDTVTATGDGGLCEGEQIGQITGQSSVLQVPVLSGVPVSKVATPPRVNVGDTFQVAITVQNPFDCELRSVKLTDEITTQALARFAIEASSPSADLLPPGAALGAGSVVWNDIGPIAAGASKTVTTTTRAQGSGGFIIDTAKVDASLEDCRGTGVGAAQVAGLSTPLRVEVSEVLAEPPLENLPETGAGTSTVVFPGLLFAALGSIGIARSRRRR